MLKYNPRFIPPLGPPKLKTKERVLAQWRGIHTAPEEKSRARTGKTIAEVMPKVLSGLRMDRRRSEAEIVKVWNHLIDPQLTAHAQPVGIHKGTLFVTVDSDVWKDEIVRYRRKEILERLQHAFGKDLIARISFRVG
jgi:predicted nucleic acid-binding Zn ribbon protein